MTGETLDEKLSKEEAIKLLTSKQIKVEVNKNFDLLQKAANESAISLLQCKNPEINLQRMHSQVVFVAPDFLQNPKNEKHKKQKEEIEIYINSFDNILKQINDYIEKATEALKNLKDPSIKLNNEIENVTKDFTSTAKNLCAPLVYDEEGLESIKMDDLNEEDKKEFEREKKEILIKLNEFLQEANNLNSHYSKEFNPIKEDILYVCNSIEIIPKPINDLKEKIGKYKVKLEDILDKITDENDSIHQELLEVKELFRKIKQNKGEIIEDMERSINISESKYEGKKEIVDPLKKEIDESIGLLRSKSDKIKEEIIELREKYNQKKVKLPDMKLKTITTEKVKICVDKIFDQSNAKARDLYKIINEKKEVEENKLLKRTSLDLLYLMDITGSMEAYVENTKRELINVMKKIIESFNGIDIHLGFIGYKDLEEHSKNDFIDIDFTEKENEHQNIKRAIERVEIGGGGDTAEDIAWAFERALSKKWYSNARFAILTGDAPCHGLKYHGHPEYDDYPEGIPGRKDIEESINQLSDMNVCLFCIKLSEKTDMMFDIFKKIYVKNNKEHLFLMGELENPDNLNKLILEKCKEVYKRNRNET